MMKKYIVSFVQLALFFAVFASGSTVIGMEKDVPVLPSEVYNLILTKVLRLVLDEVEDNPQQLMSRKKLNFFSALFVRSGGVTGYYESTNNIDYVLRLIAAKTIGADPNTKSYKGNNVLHLLVLEASQTEYQDAEDSEFKALKLKVELLSKYGLDLNTEDGKGNTITQALTEANVFHLRLIFFLQELKMIQNIKKTIKKAMHPTLLRMDRIINTNEIRNAMRADTQEVISAMRADTNEVINGMHADINQTNMSLLKK